MPFVKIETNCEVSQQLIKEITTQVSDRIHENNGNPKITIAVVFNTKVNLSFCYDLKKPAAAIEILIYKVSPEATAKITEDLSDIFLDLLGVPFERMYVFFNIVPQLHLIGWNGTTFDRINIKELKDC